MKTNFQNWSTVTKTGPSEIFLRLDNHEVICLVDKPRSVSAYWVKPSVGGRDARALHLYTEKKSRRYDGLLVLCKRLLKEYPSATRV